MARNRSKSERWLAAAREGNLAMVRQFIAEKINVNSSGSDGRTALMNGSGGRHEQIVHTLILAGAEVNQKSNNGTDALLYALAPDWAGLFKHSKDSVLSPTVAELLRAGAEVRSEHVLCAVQNHQLEIVTQLANSRRPIFKNYSAISKIVAQAKTTQHERNVDLETSEENLKFLLSNSREAY